MSDVISLLLGTWLRGDRICFQCISWNSYRRASISCRCSVVQHSWPKHGEGNRRDRQQYTNDFIVVVQLLPRRILPPSFNLIVRVLKAFVGDRQSCFRNRGPHWRRLYFQHCLDRYSLPLSETLLESSSAFTLRDPSVLCCCTEGTLQVT